MGRTGVAVASPKEKKLYVFQPESRPGPKNLGSGLIQEILARLGDSTGEGDWCRHCRWPNLGREDSGVPFRGVFNYDYNLEILKSQSFQSNPRKIESEFQKKILTRFQRISVQFFLRGTTSGRQQHEPKVQGNGYRPRRCQWAP